VCFHLECGAVLVSFQLSAKGHRKKNQRGKNRKMMRMMSEEQLLYCMTKGGIKLCEITNDMEKVNEESLLIVSANARLRGQLKFTDVTPSKSRWFFKIQ